MADQLQLRRGTTSEILGFTGAQGEVIMNTDTNSLVVQDGTTAGGFPTARSEQIDDGTFYYNEDAGSAADAYVLVPKANTNTPSSYKDGVQFGFVTTHPNTGPSTANFQGIGVVSLKYPGGVDPLAGEISGRIYLIYDAANGWMEIQRKNLGPPPQIRTVGATLGGSAITFNLQPCVIDFRAASLGSGAVSTKSVASAISVTAPAGATLGTANAVQSRIVILAIAGPVNAELAVINLAGGVNLDETTLINTTAITSGSNLANVAYSTTARSGVPFRVVGFVDSTQATAGTWSTAPSTIQGSGGQAIAALASFGYGQTWQVVTGSRLLSTTYTNTTGKAIMVIVTATSTAAANLRCTTGGVVLSGATQTAGITSQMTAVVTPGADYQFSFNAGTGTLGTWSELR